MHPHASDFYTSDFYEKIGAGSRRSAAAMLPLVLQLVQPCSVVDVGCGVGAWLAEARASGITDVLGLDGAYVDLKQLQIPRAQFLPAELSAPPSLKRQFDLVLSLEVAEHLPETQAAAFVAYLTSLGSIVLFSAAIPQQGGDGHLNEQWPAYWAALFAGHGFHAVDCLRARFWNHPDVEFWYAQNALLFVKADHPRLPYILATTATSLAAEAPLPLIHPHLYLRHYQWLVQADAARASQADSLRTRLTGLPTFLRRVWQRRPAIPSASTTARPNTHKDTHKDTHKVTRRPAS